MHEQASLPGFDAEPEQIDSLFFAILPESAAATQIELLAKRLRGEHGLKGRALERERFHITLHYLGGYAGVPPNILAAATKAAASVSAAPFEIAFDRTLSFSRGSRSQPLVLSGAEGLAGLNAFQQSLGLAMRKTGLGRWVAPRYTPHLTLLYDDRAVEQTVETISWTAREFVLINSLVGQHRHQILGRWRLRG